jgi:hypothetical protein
MLTGFPLKLASNEIFLLILLSFFCIRGNLVVVSFLVSNFGRGESTTGLRIFFSDLKTVFSANLDANCELNSCLD